MTKFFNLNFSTKEVIYILGVVSSFIYSIGKINTIMDNHEYRISELEKAKIELSEKVNSYILSNDKVNANNKTNFFKLSNAILPKETRIEIE